MRASFLALVGLFILSLPCAAQSSPFSSPLERGKALRNRLLEALDHAVSVKVSEHTSRDDKPFDSGFKERTLRTIQLNKEQIDSLRKAFPVAKDESGSVSQNCVFNEHHVIWIKGKNGEALTLHLCFECGELVINNEEDRVMPEGWSESLATFIDSLGMHSHGPWKRIK